MEVHFDPNNLFYFYSTVAQSMSALIAFLGVFVVFRMQYLDNLISNLDRALDNNTTQIFHRSFNGDIDLYNKVEVILKEHEGNDDQIQNINEARELIANCKKLRLEKGWIRKYFIWPTIFSIITIVSSVFGILLIDNKNELSNSVPSIVVITVISALIAIGMMFYLLFLSLKGEKTIR